MLVFEIAVVQVTAVEVTVVVVEVLVDVVVVIAVVGLIVVVVKDGTHLILQVCGAHRMMLQVFIFLI